MIAVVRHFKNTLTAFALTANTVHSRIDAQQSLGGARWIWLALFACCLAVSAILWGHIQGFAPLSTQVDVVSHFQPEENSKAFTQKIDPSGASHKHRASYKLYEDGVALGPRTDIIDTVRTQGEGRWAYWRGTLWFTASDATNPMTNQRHYVLSRPYPIPSWIMWSALALAPMFLVLAMPGASIAGRFAVLTGVRSASMALFVLLAAGLFWLRPHQYLLSEGDNGPDAGRLIVLTALMIGACLTGPGMIRRLSVGLAVFAAMFSFATVFVAAPLLDGMTLLAHTSVTWGVAIVIAAAAAVLTNRFPGFAIVPACLYAWLQHSIRHVSLIRPNVDVDWTPVAETTIFLTAGLAVVAVSFRGSAWVLARAQKHQWKKLEAVFVKSNDRREMHTAIAIIVMLFIAAHFGNYYYSAVEKLTLDGGPFHWLVSNPTYYLGANGSAIGSALISLSPDQLALWRDANWLGNFVTLGTQAVAVLAPLWPIILLPLTVIYDVWHFTVFALTGIFFWKWMTVNAVIVGIWPQIRPLIGWRTRILSAVLIVLSPQFFTIIKLGWYDTPALNRIEILAERDDGVFYATPPSFFGNHSFAFLSSLNWGASLKTTFYPTDTWGSTKEALVAASMARCEVQKTPEATDLSTLIHPNLPEFVRKAHQKRLVRPARRAADGVYLYPHHVFTSPLLYRDFEELELARVRAYVIRVQAICTDPITLETAIVRNVEVARVSVATP